MAWQLPGYEPMDLLGSGSTGTVMMSRDLTTDAVVAIKYLSKDVYRSPGFADRFRDEATVLTSIENPHLAQVYDYVEGPDSAAIVTDLIDGVSLRRLIDKGGALDPESALYMLKGALLGLAEAHRHGIVHRDVKPENLIIDSAIATRVVDVGIAARLRRNAPAAGDPRYLAPELWSGRPATPESDVYAAAATLFECLTGEPPRATDGDALAGDGPTDLAGDDLTGLGDGLTGVDETSAVQPAELPDPMGRFIARQLALRPADRAANAGVMLGELEMAALDAYGTGWEVAGKTKLARRIALALRPRYTGPVAAGEDTAGKGASRRTKARRTKTRRANSPKASSGQAASRQSAFRGAFRQGAFGTLGAWVAASGRAITGRLTAAAARLSRAGRRTRVLIAVALVIVLGAGIIAASSDILFPGKRASANPTVAVVPAFSHTPVLVPGPAVPAPIGTQRDETKPAQPTGLRLIGRSRTAVSLDWNSSQDNVKVVGYIVARGGRRVGTTYLPGFTDTGLTTNTRYAYTVTAFDAAGNLSPTTPAVAATTLITPDTAPPSVPTGLHSAGRTTNSITLTWTASHDNTGVAGYDVIRDGTVITSVTRPTFTDAGLTEDSTHKYAVAAFDTSNNASDKSPTLTVATLPTTPTHPIAPPTIPTSAPTTAPPPPPPTVDSITISGSAITAPDCTTTIEAKVTVTGGPITVELDYTINGTSGTQTAFFDASGSQTVGLGNGDGTTSGSASVDDPVSGRSDALQWVAPAECLPAPPASPGPTSTADPGDTATPNTAG